MYLIERKSELISILERNGKITTDEAAEHFGISRETARRDFRALEAEGVLQRTHGGAVLNSAGFGSSEYPLAIREIQRHREKNEICKKAASFINDGDIVFADNSSTTQYLARYIPQNIQVTILTNSLGLLTEAVKRGCERHTYICLGGTFKIRNLSMHGSITESSIKGYYPDKLFMSCTGISLRNAILTDGSMDEVESKKLMIKNADQVILLADHTKLDKNGQVHLCGFSDINLAVFDSESQTLDLSEFRSLGIRLVFA